MPAFDFKSLFILDLANNHQGDVDHALRIIRGVGEVVQHTGVRAALKFQFRNLDTLVHPDYRDRADVKHIPRFLETALTKADYAVLADEVRKQGMLTMATPFDEDSVDLIRELDLDLIKIASCSAADMPLFERVAQERMPLVVSTGGLTMNQIDNLVSFLQFRDLDFALMHCVAVYPSPKKQLNLNQIANLKERFLTVPVGFSTHEDPDNCDAIRVAHARGSELFERHVGVGNETYPLNAYSSTPEALRAWIEAWQDAVVMCGGTERSPASPDEIASLRSLMRGVYAAKPISKGEQVGRDDVFFAMPLQDAQLLSGKWCAGIVANRDYEANEPLSEELANCEFTEDAVIDQIMLQVKGMLNQARVYVGNSSSVEISHHYGLERFREFGCIIVDCVNREYCKKMIVQLPRQKHPYHYHIRKEETFQLLYGDLEIELEGHRTQMGLGDTFLVLPGKWHKFHTLDGAIVEEVSTTHHNDDSIYEDERISRLPREQRKTKVNASLCNWWQS